MALYAFHDLLIEVEHEGRELEKHLPQLLQELSFTAAPAATGRPVLRLSIALHDDAISAACPGREIFKANDVRGFEAGDDFYLTDDSSLLHFQPARGYGRADLTSRFFDKHLTLQVDFLAFGLVKLLRPLGLYGLHTAALVSPQGDGILAVGQSGSGKSTLSVGLIQQGWGYLSDEIVLLRCRPEGVEALALCKGFYLNAAALPTSGELPLGEEIPFGVGRKRRLDIEAAYPRQYTPRCVPRVVLFPTITQESRSSLLPLNRLAALKHLLMQSGPQWFDRSTMGPHLEALKTLVQQAAVFELRAGRDLHQDPLTLARLLAEAEGELGCPPASSSS